MAGATLIYGNLAALPQNNLKRLLSYSSIGHAGYLLLAIASIGAPSMGFGSVGDALGFYLFAYLLMTLLGFLVFNAVTTQIKGEEIRHFNGLAKRSPLLAFGLLIAMASLAGVPLTAGFYGKFLVFAHAIAAHHWALVGIGFVAVGAGFYFYLRVVAAMYWQEPADTAPLTVSTSTRIAVCILSLAIVGLGLNPKPVLSSLQQATATAKAAPASH
jgi:NADH-quinone oxidoreductase subunit N